MKAGWPERTSWTLGVTLVLAYATMRVLAGTSSSAAVQAFDAGATIEGAVVRTDRIDQSAWSSQRIAAFAGAGPDARLPEAVLRIPELRLETPVYEGTDATTLNRGAGRIRGTGPLGSDGNVGIAAHRDGFFRSLEAARPGQIVYLDLPRRRLVYRIVATRIVDPTAVEVLAATGRPTVTLVTCFPFYFVGTAPRRFIVHAEAVATAGLRGTASFRRTIEE